MPIRGLTDQTDQFGSGLPRIGTLYKGDEKPKEGNRPGKDLNYFRMEFEPQYEYLRDLWTEMFGDEPDSFERVFLSGETPDDAFGCWKEEWTATGLLHRCDGEFQKVWYDKRTGFFSQTREKCAASGMPPCQCKPTGRLSLILPEFIDKSGVLGVVSVTTHSLNDILTLSRYLNDIFNVYGTLNGVPFIFGRAARELGVPRTDKQGNRTGERLKVNKSLMYLYVTPEFTQTRLLPILAGVVQRPAAAALPAATNGLPEIDTATARGLLGGGDKPRRLGGEPPKGDESTGEAAVTPGWIADLGRRTNFLAWAKTQLQMGEEAVFTALANAYAVAMNGETLTDWSAWQGDEKNAMAACVAGASSYDFDAIETLTSGSTLKLKEDMRLDLFHIACEISEIYQAQQAERIEV